MENSSDNRRNHPRVPAPRGMAVAWRSGSLQGVSRLGTMGLGGLFLNTANPPAVGSTLELLFDVATGAEVRARAVVRNTVPGKGMGIKFVHMDAEHRSRLTNFLKAHLDGEKARDESARKVKQAEEQPLGGAGEAEQAERQTATDEQSSANADVHVREQNAEAEKHAEAGQTTGEGAAGENANSGAVAAEAADTSEEELERYLSLSEKSTHYQLLGVTKDCGNVEIKQGFYMLARKFHPDRHMSKPEWAADLQQLMGAVTEAYNVLIDEKKRGSYDRKLLLASTRTETDESIEECLKLAASAQRDENLAGAIVWLQKCVKLGPEVAKHHAMLAAALAKVAHHRREAVEHFQKAIELDQWNASAYVQLGELYEAMQLPWRAETLYSKVLEFDPEHAIARQRLVRLNSKEKKKQTTGARMAGIFSRKG